MNTLLEKLSNVQSNLNVPKGQKNTFGNYNYRSCEDILNKCKPVCSANGLMLTISDEIIIVSERYYVKSTATIMEISTGEKIEVSAFARESLSKKGQDESQITGTTSSYARKYALNGLFLLDDTKDADSDEYHNQTKKDDQPSAKEQKEVETIKQQKISELKVKAIQAAMAKERIDPQSVLNVYKIKSFEEMTEEMFLDANKKLGGNKHGI